jgi:hypothetical protein
LGYNLGDFKQTHLVTLPRAVDARPHLFQAGRAYKCRRQLTVFYSSFFQKEEFRFFMKIFLLGVHRDRCYNFRKIFAEKFGGKIKMAFLVLTTAIFAKKYHNIRF